MLASEGQRPGLKSSLQSNIPVQLSSDSLKSAVVSKVLLPVPPSVSATRNFPFTYKRKVARSKRVKPVFSEYLRSTPKKFGLEIKPEQMIWKGWEPGEEYTKNLVLKNVHMKTQKIRYKVPSMRYFSTLLPQVIVLSAGTSFTLPIIFRPLEKIKYDDEIEFTTSHGVFSIPLVAYLPETHLFIPESLHFGLCAAHDTVELSFEIRNMSSELTTSFSWEVTEPFTIMPPTGTLQPRDSCFLKAVFRPTSAAVYEVWAICCYGYDSCTKKIKLEGIGKFPHLILQSSDNRQMEFGSKTLPIIEFGDIEIHKVVEKKMILRNLSPVRAPFKIQVTGYPVEMDNTFNCPVKEGVVAAHGNVEIPVSYCPHVNNTNSISYYEVSVIGEISKSLIACHGRSRGCQVTLSTTALNFDIVSPGKESVRIVEIQNTSTCTAYFQMLLDVDSSVWHTNHSCGVLSPNESLKLILMFTPTHAINYYRRITILVLDHNPLFIDLIGTCHERESLPPQLKLDHLHRYKVHRNRGLSFYPPEVLSQRLKEKKLLVDKNGCLDWSIGRDAEYSVDNSQDYPLDEYFDDGHNTIKTYNPPHISLDKMELWFGEVEYGSSTYGSHHMSLQMTNHTKGKITAIWAEDMSGAFEIIPAKVDIGPERSLEFRVVFKSSEPNKFYGTELECYAFYKTLRDYRLVEDILIAPPWCVTCNVSAHTFNGNNETFWPRYSLSSHDLTFPASGVEECSYRSILLKNIGNTPLLYQFLPKDQESNPFSLTPCQGLMKSKFVISTFRLTPSKVNTYQQKIVLRLNDNEKHDQNINLSGSGEQPELLLYNNAEVYFRPTCEGTSTEAEYTIQNTGRLPVVYDWIIPTEDRPNLNVEPKSDIIQPNEIKKLKWIFTPHSSCKYVFKPICVARLEGKNEGRKFLVRAIGEGWTGDIQCETNNVDFGCVVAGSNESRELRIFNNSRCDLRYQLSVEQFVTSAYGENPDKDEPIALQLSSYEGILPSRAKSTLTVIVKPYRRVVYMWAIYYDLINEKGEKNCESRLLLCEMSAEGVYPSLSVIDARSTGSGANISKTQLWRWFSLDNFNSCLDADPDDRELMYSVATRHSTNRRPSVYTRSIMDFNFGAAPIDSEPCYVNFMLKNTSAVTTEWAFLFPKDLELQLDYWMETGEFDPDEIHELHVQDNKLFTVTPQRGSLRPGESKTILFCYKHDVAGTHRLPVLFKVENGREILVNFTGVTVENNRRYIHFPGNSHVFTPVALGGPTPPKQLYEVYNGGSMAVVYEVNMLPLKELEEENFGHAILTCLTPRGEVLAGTSANIEFIFAPLEAKTYNVDIPIHIVGGDTALVSFTAIGYDSRALGATMPLVDQPPEYSAVPKEQIVPVPGQLLFLSQERINIGNIPLFNRSRHVIFLTNKSSNRPVSYSWHASSETVNEVLRIEPVQGYLKPNERIMTKITFCASGQPSFYDLDLICEVIDEIKMEEYHIELEQWESEKRRQESEFVIYDTEEKYVPKSSPFAITSNSVSPRKMNLENILNKNSNDSKLTESQTSKYTVKSETRKYSTLPPIRFQNPVKLPSDRSRKNRKEEEMEKTLPDNWPRPLTPEPFVCHLGVTARTHDISEYRTYFSSECKKQFVDRMLQISHPIPPKPVSEQYMLTTCNKEESESVSMIMSSVIRSLLDDPTFHDAVFSIDQEPTPLFRQFAGLSIEDDKELSKLDIEEDSREEMVQSVTSVTIEPATPVSQRSKSKLMDEILKQSEGESQDFIRSIESLDDGSTVPATLLTSKTLVEQEIKRMPLFGSILEDVLGSTLSNIMTEALRGEVILTARPRVVALPPSKGEIAQTRISTAASSGKSSSSRAADSHKSSTSSYSEVKSNAEKRSLS